MSDQLYERLATALRQAVCTALFGLPGGGPNPDVVGAALPEGIDRPVYPDTISAAFQKARSKAGVDHVELRHLRHDTATQLLGAGVDERTVAGRLCHARPAMTFDRYAAWVPARDWEAAEVLGCLGSRPPETDSPAQ